MKELLILGPFLFLRKVLLFLLTTLVFLAGSLYFLLNSPTVIEKIADNFAPDYNITYSRIYGGVLEGVKIDNLAYNKQRLAKKILFKWTPNLLIKKKLLINKLEIEELDIDAVKKTLSAFTPKENADKNETETNSTFVLPVEIAISHLHIDVKPFVEAQFPFQKTVLELDDVLLKGQKLTLKNLTLSLNSKKKKGLKNILDPLELDELKVVLKDARVDIEKSLLEKSKLDLRFTSNLSKVHTEGNIVNNSFKGVVHLTPTKELFTLYEIPLKRNVLGKVDIKVDATEERVIAEIDKKELKQCLKAKKDAFNLDINTLHSIVVYDIKKATLEAKTNLTLDTPYGEDVQVSNIFTMDKKIAYKGEVKLAQIKGVEAKYVAPLKDLVLTYKGDVKSASVKIDALGVKGHFTSKDFKNAKVHLESKKRMLIADFVDVPKELKKGYVDFKIDAPLQLNNLENITAKVKIDSNIVTMDSTVKYNKDVGLTAKIKIPKKSLLKPYSKELKWDKLNPIDVKAKLVGEKLDISLKANKVLTLDGTYNIKSTKVSAKANIAGIKTKITGSTDKKLKIQTKVAAIEKTLKKVQQFYLLAELPKVKGAVNIDIAVNALKTATLHLHSPKVILQGEDKKTKDIIKNIDIVLGLTPEKVTLKSYNLKYKKQKLFGTKASGFMFANDVINISPLWLNDQLKIDGNYDILKQKGEIITKAKRFHIAHELASVDAKVDVKTIIDKERTTIKGRVDLLGGNIYYDIATKTFATDSDIIILQKQKKQKESAFMKNLSVDLKVKSKRPIVYKQGDINVKAKVDVSLFKAINSELLVFGSVELLKGGYYIFEEKKFVLKKSFVHFTGNPNKPLLEISVGYKALNHNITISVSGNPTAPNINFSSKPSLSREQILSIILFDSDAGAGTNSGEDMMRMMGGAMAKSVLANMGVKLDHLVLGEGNSIEVGKKLTKKITIIYVNDIISKVKLKYQHGRRTESIIGVSEESQSYDIVYKQSFKNLLDFF